MYKNELLQKATNIKIGDRIVGKDFFVIAGPCSVESEEQIVTVASVVRQVGAQVLRGGTKKLRTIPGTFRGLGDQGLVLLKRAGEAVGLPVITEVIDTRDVAFVNEYSDLLQIGARNMYNIPLLCECAKTGKPILLKRGMGATIEEWLHSAEYILMAGNSKVILCERGIRTFETETRNTLDLSAINIIKGCACLPVFADPSHATGRADLVRPMSLAAIMAGADGLEIEVHPTPELAKSDREQQLRLNDFEALMKEIHSTVEFRRTLQANRNESHTRENQKEEI